MLEEVDEGRPALGIQDPAPPYPAKRWRPHGKFKFPELRPHHRKLFKIDASGGDQVQLRGYEEHQQAQCEETVERMIDSQRKELTRWARGVIIGIEDETVCPQEVEVALNLKEKLNTIEENLVQMARMRKLEVEAKQQVLHDG